MALELVYVVSGTVVEGNGLLAGSSGTEVFSAGLQILKRKTRFSFEAEPSNRRSRAGEGREGVGVLRPENQTVR